MYSLRFECNFHVKSKYGKKKLWIFIEGKKKRERLKIWLCLHFMTMWTLHSNGELGRQSSKRKCWKYWSNSMNSPTQTVFFNKFTCFHLCNSSINEWKRLTIERFVSKDYTQLMHPCLDFFTYPESHVWSWSIHVRCTCAPTKRGPDKCCSIL